MNTPGLQDLLEEHFASRSVSRLLDLGCGDGAATRRLLFAGLKPEWVTGVDPQDNAFSPVISQADSHGVSARPVTWDFIRADAHSVVSDAIPPGELPDMILSGRMLHHVRRFGRLLENATMLLRRNAGLRSAESRLVIWEPVAADGPMSELHRIKVDVDNALGLWHRPPFSRSVLERVLRHSVSGDDVRWQVLCEVQPSREPYTESEYRSALEDMHEYAGLVRDQVSLYSQLKRRLSMLPSTPAMQPFGEPLLLAVASVSTHRS